MSTIIRSSLNGNIEEVRLKISRGEDVNSKDEVRQTALMNSIRMGHNDIVKLLLACPQIKIHEKDIFGGSALYFAAYGNNREAARMLLRHPDMTSASANSKTEKGYTALVRAIKSKKREVLQELVNHELISLEFGALDERCSFS